MKNNKIILFSFLAIIALVGISYAFFEMTGSQNGTNSLSSLDCLNSSISGNSAAIDLVDEIPVSNSVGMLNTPYSFTLTNNCSDRVKVNVGIERISSSTLEPRFIRGSVNVSGNTDDLSNTLNSNNMMVSSDGEDAYLLSSVYLEANSSNNYDLRIWIDEPTTNAQGLNKTFAGKVVINYMPY